MQHGRLTIGSQMAHVACMSKNVGEMVRRVRMERRSALHQWLFEHYEELAPLLDGRRPPWAATAETFARGGGKLVTRQAVKKAWPVVKGLRSVVERGTPVRARPEIFSPAPDAGGVGSLSEGLGEDDEPRFKPVQRRT
jgi:hypothetical protein